MSGGDPKNKVHFYSIQTFITQTSNLMCIYLDWETLVLLKYCITAQCVVVIACYKEDLPLHSGSSRGRLPQSPEETQKVRPWDKETNSSKVNTMQSRIILLDCNHECGSFSSGWMAEYAGWLSHAARCCLLVEVYKCC